MYNSWDRRISPLKVSLDQRLQLGEVEGEWNTVDRAGVDEEQLGVQEDLGFRCQLLQGCLEFLHTFYHVGLATQDRDGVASTFFGHTRVLVDSDVHVFRVTAIHGVAEGTGFERVFGRERNLQAFDILDLELGFDHGDEGPLDV